MVIIKCASWPLNFFGILNLKMNCFYLDRKEKSEKWNPNIITAWHFAYICSKDVRPWCTRKHHAGACFFTVYCTSSVQYSIQPSVRSLSSRVCIPGYSWMYSLVYSQCMVYILVYSVQSSVHSLSGIVYTPAYSPVYTCTSMHSPLYSLHSSVQLRHSWNIYGAHLAYSQVHTWTHLVYHPEARLRVHSVVWSQCMSSVHANVTV